MNDEPLSPPTYSPKVETAIRGVMWWTMLLVGVLAIPMLAFVIASGFQWGQFGQVCVFISACWISTYIGMWLMKKSRYPSTAPGNNKIDN